MKTYASVQSLSHLQLFVTPCTAAHQASLSITNSRSLLKFMSIESMMPSTHLIFRHPFLLLPSIFPNIKVFSNESVLPISEVAQSCLTLCDPTYCSLPGSSIHGIFQARVLEFQHQSYHWIFRIDFLYDWLLWSPCSPRDSQASYPTPQFKRINFLVLSFLYSPNLTSIHDYWKNHSLD